MTHNRFPKNAAGDFYTTGYEIEGEWSGECTACGLPEMEAAELLAPLTENNHDTYFVRQPVNAEEIEKAISALQICCVEALRYGGKNKDIIKRLDTSLCDYKINIFGKVVPNK